MKEEMDKRAAIAKPGGERHLDNLFFVFLKEGGFCCSGCFSRSPDLLFNNSGFVACFFVCWRVNKSRER
jgi:hypothetical protein